MYKRGPPMYTIEIFEQVGKALLISILDLFEKNPYTRVQNSAYKSLDNMRKDVAGIVSRTDRFKKEELKFINKIKNISELAYE
jgi:cytosolic carboxypeptidase protein 5